MHLRRRSGARFGNGLSALCAPQPAPGPSPFQDPNSRVVPAKDRISRLERALEAMGDSEAEVDGLRTALEKARAETRKVEGPRQIFSHCSLHLFLQYQMWRRRSREQVTVLEACVRQRISGAAGGGYIPMMPGLIPAELYQWLEDR